MVTPAFERASENLPVYRLDQTGPSLFYAPGYLAVVASPHADEFAERVSSTASNGVAGRLRDHARAAVEAYQALLTRPFSPTCLTLYLHDGCNLHCSYCLSDPSPAPTQRLDMADIKAAARSVIANCRKRNTRFTVVCHGGGEPTLEPDFLFGVLDEIEDLAHQADVPVWRYLATNGVMSSDVARRVAQRFDLIGLSCDGPESVQSVQRPLRLGGSSTPRLEATAAVVHESGTPLHVRTTVLPHRAPDLPAIVEYLCRRLRPSELYVEPVYVGGRASVADCAGVDDAEMMVDAFTAAEAVARAHGVGWITSGSRLGEVHGPYCHVYRDVLNLVPGGLATACFKTRDARSARQTDLDVGAADTTTAEFVFDDARVGELQQRLSRWPRCDDCFNRFHCVRTCPDECPVAGPASGDGFRCRFQKLLSTRRLLALAAENWPADGAVEVGVEL